MLTNILSNCDALNEKGYIQYAADYNGARCFVGRIVRLSSLRLARRFSRSLVYQSAGYCTERGPEAEGSLCRTVSLLDQDDKSTHFDNNVME